jgi:hypothetical protein
VEKMDNILTNSATHKTLLSEPLPLSGRIEYLSNDSGKYGYYVKNTYVKEGKVYHDKVYLGKVVDQNKGIFHSLKFGGYFSLSINEGLSKIVDPIYDAPTNISPSTTLLLGDVWMIDQILKKTGLDKVFESVISEDADTFKSLVAFRVINPEASYSHASAWFYKSYARVLYPQAKVESQRISEFHARIGKDICLDTFFRSYLKALSKNDNINDKLILPILIDSTGLPNCIKSHYTAVNCHHGKISKEMRLIYVVDQISKLPIYYRLIPGNIIDNSTLISTFNVLTEYNIEVNLAIMDAGYFSEKNLIELCKNGIPFLLRMIKNRNEYKRLMQDHSGDLIDGKYVVRYQDRYLFGKRVPVNICGYDLHAYIMLDVSKLSDEIGHSIEHNINSIDAISKMNAGFFASGKFILLASKEYDISEILPLYYTRQTIEQVFDISKTYAGIVPLRGHTDETVNGIVLTSFMATAVYSYLSHALNGSNYCPPLALSWMRTVTMKIYDKVKMIEELTKQHKDIFSHLQLECPFQIESENPFHKSPLPAFVDKKKKGRPVGSNKKRKNREQGEQNLDSASKGRRGRPKGSKNKVKMHLGSEMSSNPTERQGRGRPKGSKNKSKEIKNLKHT